MSAQPAIAADDVLSPFETAFVRAVLEHRGLYRTPTDAEFTDALDVLRQFEEQSAGSPRRFAWEPDLSEESLGELRGKAFVMFGTTRPTATQWHRAHAALFGPLLCETCG